LALKQADAELAKQLTAQAKAESRKLQQLPLSERHSSPSAPKPETRPTIQPLSLVPPGAKAELPAIVAAPRLTPDQVREKWWWFLTALAIAECAASILAGVILAGFWEWDHNHDGIPDHLQQPGK